MNHIVFYLCLTAIPVLCPLVTAWSQDSFFKGKTVQIIVGYPTGGGVDAEARLFGKYLERHLPGNPAVTVRNMPGAAGLIAANWFEQFAKPDGLFLHYGSSTNIVEQAFAREQVKYNLLNWDLIAGLLRGMPVAVMRPEKLDRLKSGKPLAIGSRSGEDSWSAMFIWVPQVERSLGSRVRRWRRDAARIPARRDRHLCHFEHVCAQGVNGGRLSTVRAKRPIVTRRLIQKAIRISESSLVR